MLMQSAVGTASSVLISSGINFRESLSILSKNGILIPAFPIRTLGSLRKPEIISAVSGDAFTYPVVKRTTHATIKIITVVEIIPVICYLPY